MEIIDGGRFASNQDAGADENEEEDEDEDDEGSEDDEDSEDEGPEGKKISILSAMFRL